MDAPQRTWIDVPPPRTLTGIVTSWTGYDVSGLPSAIHRGLPSGAVQLHVSIHDPIDVTALSGRVRFAALVGGLHMDPVAITHEGTQRGVSIQLDPLGARRLLGRPASALRDGVVELQELVPDGRWLAERLHDAPSWSARFAALEAALVAALDDVVDPPPEVARAWHLIRTGRVTRVGAIADEVGWSRRHLSERFRDALGVTPVEALRVTRLDHAIDLLRQRRAGLAEVAATAGFADQSHLNREFRDLAGCTPTAWIAEELPDVQDPIAVTG